MAGEARSLVEVLGGVEQHKTVENESNSEKPTTLVTLDLLGGSSIETKELDLDLHVPIGCEKRLDLKLQPGRVHIQRRNTLGSPSVSKHKLRMVSEQRFRSGSHASMAGEARSLVGVLGGVEQHQTVENESNSEKPTTLVTLDLLGGSSIETKELDLDLHVPNGWEKRLDLKLQSGRVHIQRRNTLGSPSVSMHKLRMNKAGPKHQGLNLTPSSKVPLNLFEETSLDLKLVSSSMSSSNYLSVVDNVKSALEREEKGENRKRKSSSLSSPSSSCSSSVGENQEEECQEKLLSSLTLIAAGCSRCLSYVFVMKNNPKCPRCDSVVTFPFMKKPRFDLNI